MKRTFFVILILLISVVLVSGAATIPKINSYLTDNAGVLSPSAKTYLENSLRALEKETNGVQYVVYIENEYPKEYSLEEYSLKIAEENKIGKKGNDNGLLLYVAIKDRKYRWETGYGVESTLNSALLGRISREYIVPNFGAGNYEKGILDAVNVTERILLNSSDADILALTKPADNLKINPTIAWLIVFIIIWVLIGIFYVIKPYLMNPGLIKKRNKNFYRDAATAIFLGSWARGRGGFSGSGGGLGGFSGGGGGFGGGGSSGGW